MQADARPDKNLRPDPAAVFDDDGFGDEIEGGFGVIMRPRAENGPLGKTNVGAKGHFRQTEDEDFIPDPDMVPADKAFGNGQYPPAGRRTCPTSCRSPDADCYRIQRNLACPLFSMGSNS